MIIHKIANKNVNICYILYIIKMKLIENKNIK